MITGLQFHQTKLVVDTNASYRLKYRDRNPASIKKNRGTKGLSWHRVIFIFNFFVLQGLCSPNLVVMLSKLCWIEGTPYVPFIRISRKIGTCVIMSNGQRHCCVRRRSTRWNDAAHRCALYHRFNDRWLSFSLLKKFDIQPLNIWPSGGELIMQWTMDGHMFNLRICF